MAGSGPFAGPDAEVLVQRFLAILSQPVAQGGVMLQAGNGAAPGVNVFKGHMQAAMRMRHHPRHARAGQVGHQTGSGVLHGLQQHNAEGLGALARCQAEQVALG